ncbi:MAG: hypothetical protein BM563_07135 [Bacteroidetes bacterium MedPE-SWsnd-G1]|nr:MAG: hypothetical protein BM563_07135 [Bacteroidetes bacterium MedPE-SWsnd-G1]
MKRISYVLLLLLLIICGCSLDDSFEAQDLNENNTEYTGDNSDKGNQRNNFKQWSWEEVNSNASWSARAGLKVVNHNGEFILMGGRTPSNPFELQPPVPGASMIWGDVWSSTDYGKSWDNILETDDQSHWPARAYFQALSDGEYVYLMGGQNFNIIPNFDPSGPPLIASSDFFNDVWRSPDGVNWTKLTSNAGWSGRAGLSAVMFNDEIYVMGGSVNDDSSITPNGPARIYYNDVWKSSNGIDWQLLTDNAPWAPRAGGIAVVKGDYIYMIGGEDGFICNAQTVRCPPYYNDVWRSTDGQNWELVTESSEWQARPGHQVIVSQNKFVLFGGFGLGPDITVASNPMDIWISNNGKVWKKVSSSPWNANLPSDIKYDFDVVLVKGKKNKSDMIYTFGGDRETFNFLDFSNYLNVDNDVWKFSY